MKEQNPLDEKAIEGHEYDGITELDNPLPGWWLATFYITVVFAILYFAYYSLGSGPTLVEELKSQFASMEKKNPKPAAPEGPDGSKLEAFSKDPKAIESGAAVYQSRCASCHGTKGEGLIGPNLTDKFWIHGKATLTDIAKVIGEGVADKGMPGWKALLKEDELLSVTVYVQSLRNTNPPNAKAPQGEEIKE